MNIGFKDEPSALMAAVEVAARVEVQAAWQQMLGQPMQAALEHAIARAIRVAIETYAKGQYNLEDLEKDLQLNT